MPVDSNERARIEREVRQRLQKLARRRTGFTWHALVFAMAIAAMVGINLHYSPQTLWFVWPLAGWGAALAMHGYATFGGRGASDASRDRIEAEVQRELSRRGLT